MAANDLYKKAISTATFVFIAGGLLIVSTMFESNLRALFSRSEMSLGMFDTTKKIVHVILGMAIVISLVKFVAFMLLRAAARRSAQAEVSSLLRTVFSIIIYIIAFFLIFQHQYPDISLAPIFTGSTILGIVVGLALQDTLGNLFAGIAMQADQPFQVGDVIQIRNSGTGVVEGVSWRGVKIRTFQNKLLLISNSVLGKETIEVAPRDNQNARIVFFSTSYTFSPARTKQLVRDAVRNAENILVEKPPVIRILKLGDNGIEWEIKYWLDDYTRYNDTDALIRERIWYAFQREGLEFPFPTRTIHVHEAGTELVNTTAIDLAAERLTSVPIFDPLSEEEVARLAATSKTRVYAPGEMIVRHGTEGNSMFVINYGKVGVEITESGVKRKVNELSENDFFGEMSLLTGQPRTANVIAIVETEVTQIRRTSLKPILEGNPLLVQSITDIIASRQEMLNEANSNDEVDVVEVKKSVLKSIRKFFGLRQPRTKSPE